MVAMTDGSDVLVLVTMVQVRIMRMLVHCPRMPVGVAVRLTTRIICHMPMLVVVVVQMSVLMLERLMDVFVFVSFGEMQKNTDPH